MKHLIGKIRLFRKKKNNNKLLLRKFQLTVYIFLFRKQYYLFGAAKSNLYRLIRQKRIPAINWGTRLVRIDGAAIERIFPIRQTAPTKKEKLTSKLYSLEPKDCYTIGEISKKFGISDSSMYKHIRKFSIPTRQIGKYVHAPKSEIDSVYSNK